MSKVIFKPTGTAIEVDLDTKILLASRKANVALRYGCASCRCGTCAVAVTPPAALTPMKQNEKELLERMKLPIDGTVRLSCQAKICADIEIDISFQDTYSPDDGDEF